MSAAAENAAVSFCGEQSAFFTQQRILLPQPKVLPHCLRRKTVGFDIFSRHGQAPELASGLGNVKLLCAFLMRPFDPPFPIANGHLI